MRHKSISTTMAHYVEQADDEADDLWKKLGAGDSLCDTPARSALSPTGEDDGRASLESTSECPLMDSNHQPSD